MAHLKLILYLLVGLAVTACGHSDSFHVDGTLAGGESINIRTITYTDGTARTGITAATKGKFAFDGSAPKPAMVEIYDNDYRLLGRFFTVNGDDIEISLDRTNPAAISIEGNDVSEQWAKWLRENTDKLRGAPAEQRNAAVAEFVAANPESKVAELLIITEMAPTLGWETLADSLLHLIPDASRLAGISGPFAQQSARVADGASLSRVPDIAYRRRHNLSGLFAASDSRLNMLVISNNESRPDSLLELLRALDKHRRAGRFDIVDLSVDTDTLAWNRSTRPDSAEWRQGWVPGSVAAAGIDSLGIPSLPYIIVADSLGHQLWRGTSTSAAFSFIKTREPQF